MIRFRFFTFLAATGASPRRLTSPEPKCESVVHLTACPLFEPASRLVHSYVRQGSCRP